MTSETPQAGAVPQALRLLSAIEGVKWTENGGEWVSAETVHRLAGEAIADLESVHAENAAREREDVTPASESGS